MMTMIQLLQQALAAISTALVQGAPGQQMDPRQMLLAQLRDIKTPEPLTWWPPAPGWWFLAAVILSIFGAIVSTIIQRKKKQRYRKVALKELHELSLGDAEPAASAKIIMQILKRTFFTAYPEFRHYVAGLYGEEWLKVLRELTPKARAYQSLDKDVFALLYGKPSATSDAQLQNIRSFAEDWIKQHPSSSQKNLQMIRAQLQNSAAAKKTEAGLAHV